MKFKNSYDWKKLDLSMTVPEGSSIGFSPEYPLYSLAHLYTALNLAGNENPVRPYNEALINVYLYSGAHHYISC